MSQNIKAMTVKAFYVLISSSNFLNSHIFAGIYFIFLKYCHRTNLKRFQYLDLTQKTFAGL